MKPVRTLIAGVTAMAIAAPAIAETCVQPAERTAMDVRALQSHLMVVAIACHQGDAYDAFVRRQQPVLAGAWRSAEGHFRRIHGARNGQKRFDDFNTVLANAHAQDQIRGGSFFCRDYTPMLQEAASLPSDAGALAQFAQERNLVNPYAPPVCTNAPAPQRATRATRVRARR